MKPSRRESILKLVILTATFIAVFIVFGGWLLDDSHLDPYFGLRVISGGPSTRDVDVNRARYYCDSVRYEVDEAGASDGGVDVALIRDGMKILGVGGKKGTFVGFRDIDGDGINEVLVTSGTRYAEKGIWKVAGAGFEKVSGNLESKLILKVANLLNYAWLGLLGCFMVIDRCFASLRKLRKRRETSSLVATS